MSFIHDRSTSESGRPFGFVGSRSHSPVRSPVTSKEPPFMAPMYATPRLRSSRCTLVKWTPQLPSLVVRSVWTASTICPLSRRCGAASSPASPKHTRDTRTSAPSMTRRWPRAGRVAIEIAPDRRPSGRFPPGRVPFHILCGERLGSRAGSRKAKGFAAALLAGEEGSAAGGASSAFTPSGVRGTTRCGLPSRR